MEVKNSKIKSWRDWVKVIFSGFCMGCADIVPGVSGGTIAFILGIYEDFIDSITSFDSKAAYYLCTFQFKKFHHRVSWRFLTGLLLGIILAFGLLAKLIHNLLLDEVYRTYLYSCFLGLIFAALIFCFKLIRIWKWRYLLGLFAGGAIAYLFTQGEILPKRNERLFDVQIDRKLVQQSDTSKTIRNYEPNQSLLLNVMESEVVAMISKKTISTESTLFSHEENRSGKVTDFITNFEKKWFNPTLFTAGAIAISAMLLPGISGSYMLTAMGMYALAVGSLADFFSGLKTLTIDIDAFIVLANLGLGIIFGGISFSRVASWMLHKHPNFSVSTLTGFMVGALPSIWPFWIYEYHLIPLKLHKGVQIDSVIPIFPNPFTWNFLVAVAMGATGFALVLFLESFAKIKGSSFETAED